MAAGCLHGQDHLQTTLIRIGKSYRDFTWYQGQDHLLQSILIRIGLEFFFFLRIFGKSSFGRQMRRDPEFLEQL